MKKPYAKSGFGGKGSGSRFGGSKPWERGGEVPRSMHRATCSECGQPCEVPFKPNGKKPIFCSNCFRKDDYGAPKRSYEPRDHARSNGSGDSLNDQLRTINSKLDAIIRALDV